MTQLSEGAGPSNSTSNGGLPLRSRRQEEPLPASHRDIEVFIDNAISTGRTISETLAGELRHGDFANEENNLRPILTLAEELRSYQSPVEFTIGLVGDSGAGKSSLINSLLDVERLAKAGADGTACTSAATEYRKIRASDPDVYNVEIECMNEGEIEGLLQQCVVDYRQYHLRDLDHPLANSEEELLQKKAKVAWDTIAAAFGNTPGCTERRFRDQAISIDYIQREVRTWKDGIQWPVGFNAPGVLIHSAVPEDCVSRIDNFLSGRIWPFVKVVRIYLDAEILNSGLVLVDLPGRFLRDIPITDISRASTNQGVNRLVRQLGANFNNLKRSQGVAIVCTKSEVSRTQEPEILRDIPNTGEFNPQVTNSLWDDISDERDDGRPTMHLEASEAQTEERELDARMRRPGRRRTTSATEQFEAIRAKQDGSGIIRLREFCQGIPSRSQIAETRHFLNTRVLNLLEKVELWCNARDVSEDRRQAPVERLHTLQRTLKDDFDASLIKCDEELYEAKVDMLRPFSQRPNIIIWERRAISFAESLLGWNVQTLDAFWRQDGAYQTPASRGYIDWNEKFIEAMVERFEPTEASFQNLSDGIFLDMEISVLRNLSILDAGLRDPSFTISLILTEHRTGKRKRIIQKLCTTIEGNRHDRKLFVVIKELFRTAMDKLLDETNEKLKAVTDRCCEDIRVDLGLLDVVAPAADQGLFVRTMSSLLERSKADRDQAQGEFDSQFPDPEASV
ncbi:hypothetical protein V494_01801 [Pseudogymnoascus sp. VKM F-4513 (FW-928)]|nr:hypothetical protein V494_01801 [Pseudogymnoascus sp. VKM F-4513 (FW-928)]